MQVIAFLCALFEKHRVGGPHLIVMPLSVVSSWRSDLQRFVRMEDGVLDVYVHHGEKAVREVEFASWLAELRRQRSSNGRGPSGGAKRDRLWIVLTTYEMVMSDEQLLRKFNTNNSVSSSHRGNNSGNQCNLQWEYLVVRVVLVGYFTL